MQELRKAIEEFGINLPDEVILKLDTFISEVISKNKLINLISKNDIPFIIERHLIDSLIPLKFQTIPPIFEDTEVLDIGSGSGFPGLVLAIVFPNSRFVLSESIKKRYEFLLWVKEKLKLKNVEVLNERIEKNHPNKYQVITERAAGRFDKLLTLALSLLKPNGYFISWLSREDSLRYQRNFNFIYNYNLKGREMSLCIVRKS